jgi:hypothetical protein
MSKDWDALRIADWFEGGYGGCELEAAAELRRLHAENEQLRVALEKETAARRDAQIQLAAAYEARNRAGIEFRRLAAKENAELVEALNSLLNDVGRANSMLGAVKARAALAKVGDNK